jgi:copper transport protein
VIVAFGGERRTRRRWRSAVVRRLALVTPLLFALASPLVGPTSGHAILLRTDPPDGIVFSEPPHRITLTFSEPILLDYSSFDLVDGDGAAIPIVSTDSSKHDTEIVLTLPDLEANTFRLDWETVSSDDFHTVSGMIVFGAGAAAGAAPERPVEPTADPLETLLGWLGFVAFAGLLGALIVGRLIPTDEPIDGSAADTTRAPRRRLVRLAVASAVLGLAVMVLTLLTEAASVTAAGDGIDQVLAIATGTAHGLRTLAILALYATTLTLIAVWAWRSRSRSPIRFGAIALLVFGLAMAGLRVLNGHATASADGSVVPLLAATIHTLAAAIWVGGLIGLSLAVVPLLREPATSSLGRSVVRRFGTIAAASLAFVLVSGLVVAGGLVASLDALVLAGYGHVLLVKIALVVPVLLIGLANAVSAHPNLTGPFRPLAVRIGVVPGLFTATRPDVDADGRATDRPDDPNVHPRGPLIRLEMAGAALVVLLAATLGATQPATGPVWAPPEPIEPSTDLVAGPADDLLMSMTIRPNLPGRNFISVNVFNTRRPEPAPIEHVSVSLTPADGSGQASVYEVASIGDGHYETAVDLVDAGRPLDLAVTATRPGLSDAILGGTWTITATAGPIRTYPVMISAEPLAPVLSDLATFATIALLAMAAIAGLRKTSAGGRRERRSVPTTELTRRSGEAG